MSLSLSTLTARLSDRLKGSLPGHEAQLKMAPRDSARETDVSVDGRDCDEAAVLVLLVPSKGNPVVVLTVRHDHLTHHGGQISFPGGQREPNESLRDTALREAEEEIALPAPSVHVLGQLTPLYIPPSHFCVHPFVGAVSNPHDLHPRDREVRNILRVPLSDLLDPKTRRVEPWSLRDTQVDVPFYAVAGHPVWGATAMMLAEFLAVVRDVIGEPE